MLRCTIYRRVWQFAWPAIISNISVPLMGLVDTAILGHLPSAEYLGGVAIGATIFSFLFWAFGFLRMGTTGLVAQAYGRGDHEALGQWLLQSVILALMIGLVIVIVSPMIITPVLSLFGGSTHLTEQARIYFEVRIFSTPAVLCNYVVVGWLLGVQKPKGPLIILVVANIVNILLDLLLVLRLGMATEGAAAATVIADYVGLSLGLLLIWRWRRICSHFERIFDWARLIDFSAFKKLLLLNRHLFVRTLCLLFVQAFFTAAGAKQGDEVLAANALLLNLLLLTSNALDGFAHAAEALVGEALGQNKLDKFRGIVKVTGFFSLIFGLLFMLLFAVGGDWLLGVMTDISEVRAISRIYLPWLIGMPLIAVWCYWLDGLFIGALEARIMQHTATIATIAVFLPCWYAAQGLGNHGLWLAYSLFMAARGIGLLLAYRWLDVRNRWQLPGR
ncbi:MAG: MATE family efflux transporter [Candidatus Endonucleobacter bathymodioli]|uniref:MATE family efflux transporter n=1 Tax=Candidatus Endonucleibacter bathymodioli TaxID=539814 RepID=A0AA90NQ85_9GAMM|nr:MATE family efflux transporter [Candidatus Endonucleobacter bathymodioli]